LCVERHDNGFVVQRFERSDGLQRRNERRHLVER
jgi:hypothetical protein